MRVAADTVAFLAELAALAAYAVWGYDVGGVALAIAMPLAVAMVWATFCSPKRRFDLGTWPTFGLRLVVLLGGALAVGGGWGVALAAAVMLDYALLAALRRPIAGTV
ncbi:MAG: DUF2568 domain-containing protein [Actinomycetota bacterium]